MPPSKSPSLPEPCLCPMPNPECRRAGQPMLGRLWELCSGSRCPQTLSEEYRRFWDGLPVQPLCIHLGPDTGERRLCETCRGRVQLKVFACGHPRHVTTTLPACQHCPDFEEP